MVLTFATFFLGLTFGVHQVTLVVSKPVIHVDVLLDGREVAALSHGPWQANVDFGEALAPHVLVAVGRDAERREVTRAVQRINLPRSLAEAALVLEPGSGGRGRTARLTWQSVTGGEPRTVAVTFDGKPLAAPDPRHIEIPPHVPERLHFLRAELDFADNVSTVADLMWGGRYSDRTGAELTAVPVLLQ